MAEIIDFLHREASQVQQNDMLLIHPPGLDMDESSTDLLPELDYEDVFGGPPRFAALVAGAHGVDGGPTAMLERTTARQFSVRTSSLPVFELPVFGDSAFSSSTVYEGKGHHSDYDGMPINDRDDSLSSLSLHGISTSKASSLSSSRRMSPVHPIQLSSASRSMADEIMGTAPGIKTRPAASGKVCKRSSLSSASSFDESSVKLGENSLMSLRNDACTSSVPSSPPQLGSSGHLKGLVGFVGVPTSSDVDDVFGGFPKRIFPQPMATLGPQNSRISAASVVPEKECIKSISTESKVIGSPASAAYSSEIHDSAKYEFSRLSSVKKKGREMPGKEPMKDSQLDSSLVRSSWPLLENVSTVDDDTHVSVHSSSKLSQPIPSATPKAELKFKSWKDLALDQPSNKRSFSSSSVIKVVSDATLPSLVIPKEGVVKEKDVAYLLREKNSLRNLPAHSNTERLSLMLNAGAHKGNANFTEYTIDSEERELQDLLSHALKINRQMEMGNYDARFPDEPPKGSEDTSKGSEERREHSARKLQSLCVQPSDSADLAKMGDDMSWKEWRKYGRRQKKEASRGIGSTEKIAVKGSNLKKQVSAPDLTRGCAETLCTRGDAQPQDLEGHQKAGAEEAFMGRVSASCEALPDAVPDTHAQLKSSKVVLRECASSKDLVRERLWGGLDGFERASSFHDVVHVQAEDFVCKQEQKGLFSCAPVVDAECLIDLSSSLDAFQEVQGEAWECRKSRWEQHMRVRERAANALVDLQYGDAELQCQEEERHKFSESSDGKIRRWSAGKEENLRALLSNLQHVLWSECRWKPIPLTDLIEVPDVKKAYRKATLFVHPDKVQQKGASLQQKYIAEKVFDILQEAWKTFNLQESF